MEGNINVSKQYLKIGRQKYKGCCRLKSALDLTTNLDPNNPHLDKAKKAFEVLEIYLRRMMGELKRREGIDPADSRLDDLIAETTDD